MEEEVTRLVENTFANHDIEESKKIIIDKILWYEEQLVNSVSKDKIKKELKDLEEIKYSAITDIGQAVYNANIALLKRLLEE
jgi:hypothetical protein